MFWELKAAGGRQKRSLIRPEAKKSTVHFLRLLIFPSIECLSGSRYGYGNTDVPPAATAKGVPACTFRYRRGEA